jgi:hypothetical protein
VTHPEERRLRRYAEEERQRNSADDPHASTECGEAASEEESDADSQTEVRRHHELRNTDE